MPRKETPAIREALERYLRFRHDLAPNTLLNDRSVLQKFARGLGEEKRIGNLTAEQVATWFADVGAPSNPKPASYNKVRTRVQSFLGYCRRMGWVRSDLLIDVRRKDVPRIERLRLSTDQLLALLDTADDPRERGFLAAAMNLGARAGELTRLRIGDVDFGAGEVYLVREKTKSDDRIALTPHLTSELRSWIESYARELGGVPTKEMYLFPSRHAPRLTGGTPPGQSRVMRLGALRPDSRMSRPERVVQRALQRIGIEEVRLEGVHTIRRSASRRLFDFISANSTEAGFDSALRVTASFLGHKSVLTTEGYLGLDADRSKRDAILRGRDFLPPGDNAQVIELRSVL